MVLDRNGLEVLDRAACLRLLAGSTLGRIGVTTAALPSVLPVAFRLDGDHILVRTGAGSSLDLATRTHVVAFEVDDVDPACRTGWSVAVTGIAREVAGAGDLGVLGDGALDRWAGPGDGRLIVISTERISGRRLLPGRP